MTYNDIVTPIRKTIYGEADIIYTLLTSNQGRVDAIAKGIRKSSSRKRGNIDFGIFSSLHFAKGKNLDIIIEAQMLEYNTDLFSGEGLRLLYKILPIVNKFATDKPTSIKIFEELKKYFILFDKSKDLQTEVELKYTLLDIQNVLPDWKRCSMCNLIYGNLTKYNVKSEFLVCNNCARKIPTEEIITPQRLEDLESLSEDKQRIILHNLDMQLKHL